MIVKSNKKNAERKHNVIELAGRLTTVGRGTEAIISNPLDDEREFIVQFGIADLQALTRVVTNLKKAVKKIAQTLPILAVLLMGCGSSEIQKSSECAPSNGHFLYVFGDSITYSLDGNSYANMMGCEKGYRVVNMAVGGTSIEFGNQYGMIMAHSRNWLAGDVVVFSPGINDAILYQQTPAHVALYTQYVTDILAIAATKQAELYFGTPNTSCDEPRFGPNADIESYAAINRALFAAHSSPRIHLVDFNRQFVPTWENTYDCIHPNALGNKAMKDLLISEMN